MLKIMKVAHDKNCLRVKRVSGRMSASCFKICGVVISTPQLDVYIQLCTSALGT